MMPGLKKEILDTDPESVDLIGKDLLKKCQSELRMIYDKLDLLLIRLTSQSTDEKLIEETVRSLLNVKFTLREISEEEYRKFWDAPDSYLEIIRSRSVQNNFLIEFDAFDDAPDYFSRRF